MITTKTDTLSSSANANTATPESIASAAIAPTTITTATADTDATATAISDAAKATTTSSKDPKQKTNSQDKKTKNPSIDPLTKKDPSKEAKKLAHDINLLFSAQQNEILDVATNLKALTTDESKITQVLLANSELEKFRFDLLLKETGLPHEQLSQTVHALKSFEILSARQSVLRFVKQADPQLSLTDQLDALGAHRSIRLGFAEQCVVGEAIMMVESQVFSLLKQRKVVQPTDLIYFVKNIAERKAILRFLAWGRLFNKVFMDDHQLLHFVPKYKAPKVVPNPSNTSTPTTADPSSSSSSSPDHSMGNKSSTKDAEGKVAASTALESESVTDDCSVANNNALASTEPQNQANIESKSTKSDATASNATLHALTAIPDLEPHAKAASTLFPLLADADEAKEATAHVTANSTCTVPDVSHGIATTVNSKYNCTVTPANHTANDSSNTTTTAATFAATDTTTTASTEAIPLAMLAFSPLAKTTPSLHQDPIIEAWLDAHLEIKDTINAQSSDSTAVTTIHALKPNLLYTALQQNLGLKHNSLQLMSPKNSPTPLTETFSYRAWILANSSRTPKVLANKKHYKTLKTR